MSCSKSDEQVNEGELALIAKISKSKVTKIIRTLGEYLLERTLVPGPRFYEEEWRVPFLATFISPVFMPDPHSTVSERPTIGSRWIPNNGLRHSKIYGNESHLGET